MEKFTPDFNNILDAAKNIEPKRIPLYEHAISEEIMEAILNNKFKELINGGEQDINEYFKNYCAFYLKMGYDTVSFERCIGPSMPSSGALGNHKPGIIKTRDDFEKYPWDEIPDYYFNENTKYFKALRDNMPKGMKAIGGPGNGAFECVQDIVGYMDLCYISVDDPELYHDLFEKVGELSLKIWSRLLKEFADVYCVCRFGDDLSFKSSTLISAEDIRKFVIPQYTPIIELIHNYNRPFLLHSCGAIFDVMDDLRCAPKLSTMN